MLRSISFHPSGDFLLVGTQHPTLRLYDVNTFQCFVSCNPLDQHTDTISGVSYNPSANSYVSCSKDGSIKLWDGVSNRCVTTFEKAHDGAEVCSAIFSKNSKYVLSSGKDSVVKLWEISTGRTLVKYTGKKETEREKKTGALCLHSFKFFPSRCGAEWPSDASHPGRVQPHRGLCSAARRAHHQPLLLGLPHG